MWTWLTLEFFKCFEQLRLPLTPLTMLTGQNASGKSTALQALVLLQQTVRDGEWNQALLLDGSLVRLGTASDLIDKITGRDALAIGIESDDFACRWSARATDRRSLVLPIETVSWRDSKETETFVTSSDKSTLLHHLLPSTWPQRFPAAPILVRRLQRLVYISAERLGPRETYPLGEVSRIASVGARGEGTPGLLYLLGEQPLGLLNLRREDAAPILIRQVEAWMQVFFPGATLEVEAVPRANLVTLGLRTSNRTDFHRPQHVGYGLTHILPIITACLAAEPGDVLAIENPEVHLHPAGQALIGRFLAATAAAGAQVLLETHSDHVLNGVRRAVKDGVLSAPSVSIHFFNRRPDRDDAAPQIVSPSVDANGNLDVWPRGFFDQLDQDLAALAGWSL